MVCGSNIKNWCELTDKHICFEMLILKKKKSNSHLCLVRCNTWFITSSLIEPSFPAAILQKINAPFIDIDLHKVAAVGMFEFSLQVKQNLKEFHPDL